MLGSAASASPAVRSLASRAFTARPKPASLHWAQGNGNTSNCRPVQERQNNVSSSAHLPVSVDVNSHTHTHTDVCFKREHTRPLLLALTQHHSLTSHPRHLLEISKTSGMLLEIQSSIHCSFLLSFMVTTCSALTLTLTPAPARLSDLQQFLENLEHLRIKRGEHQNTTGNYDCSFCKTTITTRMINKKRFDLIYETSNATNTL